MSGPDVVEIFMSNLKYLGVAACRVKGPDELRKAVSEAVPALATIYCPGETELEKLLVFPEEARTEDFTSVTVAVDEAAAAVAETGSLVCTSASARMIQGNLLPERHVALVAAGNIFASLDEWLASCRGMPPTNMTLITGPSRTADIEQTLITGVHGPERLDVIVYDCAPVV